MKKGKFTHKTSKRRNRKRRGKFVVIEGGVGCGKTTQVNLFKKEFPRWLFYREPGSTPFAEKVRDAVQGLHGYKVDPYAALFAYNASRADLIRGTILPQIKKGKSVFLDRYWFSTYAYQGTDTVSSQSIFTLTKISIAGLMPDAVLFFDLDPKIGMRRKSGKHDADRFDLKDIKFHRIVRKRYNSLGKRIKHWVTIDASKTVDEVHNDSIKALKRLKII